MKLEDKKPFYASLAHMMHPGTGAVVSVKAGLRNMLGLLDCVSLEYARSLQKGNFTRKNDVSASLSLPVLYPFYSDGSVTAGMQIGRRLISRDLDQNH